MKVIISMPMNGIPDQELKNQMNTIKQQFIAAGHEVVDSMLDIKVDGYKNPALLYLGGSVRLMADADAVYFAPGWDQARGCLIEHHICQLYGIQILNEIPKPIEKIIFDTVATIWEMEIYPDGKIKDIIEFDKKGVIK